VRFRTREKESVREVGSEGRLNRFMVDLIARIRNAGGEPNPYGLLADLRSFEEGIIAKRKLLNEIIHKLSEARK